MFKLIFEMSSLSIYKNKTFINNYETCINTYLKKQNSNLLEI